ncbi:hypothetical protein CMK13_00850, partial [Candidatus Poribacteria bacterium]
DLNKKNNKISKTIYLLEVSAANSHLPFLILLFGSIVLQTTNSIAASIEMLTILPTPKLNPVGNPKKNTKIGVTNIPAIQVKEYT